MLYEFLNNIAILACSFRSSLKLEFLPQAILLSRQQYFLEFQMFLRFSFCGDLIKSSLKVKNGSEWVHGQRKCQPLMEEQPACSSLLVAITSASELWPRNQERCCFQTKVVCVPSINILHLFALTG